MSRHLSRLFRCSSGAKSPRQMSLFSRLTLIASNISPWILESMNDMLDFFWQKSACFKSVSILQSRVTSTWWPSNQADMHETGLSNRWIWDCVVHTNQRMPCFVHPRKVPRKSFGGSIHSWFKHVTNRPKWRLMPPNRRFWKDEQKMKCRFSVDFSMARSPKSSNNALQKGPRNPAFHILLSFQNLRLDGLRS